MDPLIELFGASVALGLPLDFSAVADDLGDDAKTVDKRAVSVGNGGFDFDGVHGLVGWNDANLSPPLETSKLFSKYFCNRCGSRARGSYRSSSVIVFRCRSNAAARKCTGMPCSLAILMAMRLAARAGRSD